jgi:hypothetical protein
MSNFIAAYFADAHNRWDLIYGAVFVLGLFVFMLSRSGKAMRAGRVPKRRVYFYQNFDILLVRAGIELAVIFWPYRHMTTEQISHITGWNIPFKLPQASVLYFLIGFFADYALDHVAQMGWIPDWIKKWIAEVVPPAPPALVGP